MRAQAQPEGLEIDGLLATAAKALDNRVVPHETAVKEAARDEECRRHAVTPEDRQGDLFIVSVAVVERDDERAARQRPALKCGDGLAQT